MVITATPDIGYYVSGIVAKYADGDAVYSSVTGTAPAVDTAKGDDVTLKFNMPAADLIYIVEYEKIDYSINVVNDDNYGTVETTIDGAAVTTAVLGDQVDIKVSEVDGYDLKSLTVTTKNGITTIDLSEFVKVEGDPDTVTTSFEMPAEAVLITTVYVPEAYEVIKSEECEANGSVAINGAVATQTSFAFDFGDEVVITATPDNGYYVTEIVVKDENGNGFAAIAGDVPAVDTAKGEDVTLELVMPDYDLYYTVKYAKIDYSITVVNDDTYGTVETTVDGAAVTTAVLGDQVDIKVSEVDGYDLKSLTVTTKNGITTIDLSELVRVDGDPDTVTTSFEMPAEAVVVTAVYTTEKYQVVKGADSEINGSIVSTDENGVTNLEQTYLYDFADEVTLKITADDGYYVASVVATGKTSGTALVEKTGSEADTVVDIAFAMPHEDVEITVVYAKIVYDINTVFESTQGTVVTDPAAIATVGDLVNITVTPATGYVIDNVYVAAASGKHIALSKDSDGKYHFTMPAEDVTVTATFVKEVYTVTFKDWNGDILEIDYVDYLDAATAPADPAKEGYTFIGWDVDFSKVTADMVVIAQYEIITRNVQSHAISFTGAVRGVVKLAGNTAKYGDVVEVVCDPDDGYRVESISIKTANGAYIPAAFVKTDAEYVTTYSFVMPDCDVEIYVSFTEHASSKFTDIRTDDWYYDAVTFVADRGYFLGVSETLFAPNMKMNRAMFVTVLARMNGVDLDAYQGTDFSDVEEGSYYASAVKWASENGIVEGYGNTKFGPEDSITREQMCVIMYRYCDYMGYDTTIKNLQFMNRYEDADDVSAYASDAVKWAVGVGLIRGMSDTTINPTGYATRAQVAQIIKNLSDKVIYQ